MKRLMLLATILMGLSAYGANWTNFVDGGTLRLEDLDNWNPSTPFDATVDATITATNVTMTFETGGFTNRNFNATAVGAELTFDIAPGAELYSTGIGFATAPYVAGTPVPWSPFLVKGGGKMLAVGGNNHINIGYGATQWSNSVVVAEGTTLSTGTDFFVGNNGVDNRLTVTDGAKIAVTRRFEIGNASGSGNVALFTGARSELITTAAVQYGYTRVGSAGSGNRLIFENGATCTNYPHTVTIGDSSGTGNSMVVRNGATFFAASGTYLDLGTGVNGVGGGGESSLVVSNGAIATLANVRMGVYGGRENLVSVMDGGTLNYGGLSMGYSALGGGDRVVVANATMTGGAITFGSGKGNTVTVTNKGRITASALTMGNNASGTGNMLLVSGTGSVLETTSTLWTSGFNVGKWSDGNTFILTNGATLISAAQLSVSGYNNGSGASEAGLGSSSNTVIISGPGTAAWVTNVAASVSVGSTTGECNRLIVSDRALLTCLGLVVGGAGAAARDSAMVVSDGATVTNTTLNVGRAGNGTLQILRGGSVISSGGVEMGNGGAKSNRVEITGGSCFECTRFEVGRTASGGADTLIVDGEYSALAVKGGFFLSNGKGNRVEITGGGKVSATAGTTDIHIGSGASGGSNVVLVSGIGSSLSLQSGPLWTSGFAVGSVSHGNTLIVTNGATMPDLTSSGIYLGRSASGSLGGSDNLLLISGAGTAVWFAPLSTNVAHNAVYLSSTNNSVVINDGASFRCVAVTLGHDANSTNNLLVIDNGTLVAGSLAINNYSTLRLSGTNTLITTTNATGNTFNMGVGAVMEVVLGKVAPTEPLVNIKSNGGQGFNATAKLRINADKFAQAGGGKGIVLLRTARTVQDTNMENLRTNFTGTAGVTVGTRLINRNGVNVNELYCDVPNLAGTIILVR